MSAVITTTAAPEIVVEQRIVLPCVSWETYERIMREHEDRIAPRFTYDNGELEIYMPTRKHEKTAEVLSDIVKIITEERGMEILSLRSTTYKKNNPKQRGVEPDGCFYVQSYEQVFGIEEFDLLKFPPDLVIEVDITSPSIDRFPIYADLGVSEIWRYSNEKVEILQLQNGEYAEVNESLALPKVTGDVLIEFLNLGRTEKRLAWIKKVREWARSQQN